MRNNAWIRCFLCYTLGVAVGIFHDPWIWVPLSTIGIVVLVPSWSSKITLE